MSRKIEDLASGGGFRDEYEDIEDGKGVHPLLDQCLRKQYRPLPQNASIDD
jgi:hypothetical protein